MTVPATPGFVARPFVCGAVGRVEPGDLEGLVAASPATRVLVDDPGFVLRCRGPVDGEGDATGRDLRWGAALAGTSGGGPPSETLLCAGASRDSHGWSLYTDVLGIQPMYRRTSARGFVFATMIDPLVRAITGRAHADWEAWATIIMMGSPLGAATPFAEVRRFEAGTTVRVLGDGSIVERVDEPSWHSPSRSAAIGEVADAVREALPVSPPWRRPPAVTLSGGWDSRLLAALARARYARRPRAWTTVPDDGRDFDVDMARSVAATLGMGHRVVEPEREGWVGDAIETRERVEYQTWHHPWFAALARSLRRAEGAAMVGIGGGIVLSGHFMDREVVEASSWPHRVALLFDRFSSRVGEAEGVWSAEGGAALAGAAFEAFRRQSDRFADAEHGLALSVLHLRTARAIALMPTSLVAPEAAAFLPYLDPRVLHATVGIPSIDKLDGRLTRAVMAHAAPAVSGLPSTNDDGLPRRKIRRRLAGSRARSWMGGLVGSSAVARSLLAAAFIERVMDPSRDVTRSFGAAEARILQSLSVLAQWQVRYDDVLDPADRPGWVS